MRQNPFLCPPRRRPSSSPNPPFSPSASYTCWDPRSPVHAWLCVGYFVKCFRMEAGAVTSPPWYLQRGNNAKQRECEQAIRAPTTALRAKELWKTSLTSVKRQTQHPPHQPPRACRRKRRGGGWRGKKRKERERNEIPIRCFIFEISRSVKPLSLNCQMDVPR